MMSDETTESDESLFAEIEAVIRDGPHPYLTDNLVEWVQRRDRAAQPEGS